MLWPARRGLLLEVSCYDDLSHVCSFLTIMHLLTQFASCRRHADTCEHSAYDRANVYPFPWSDPEQQPFVQNKLRRYEAIRSVLPPDCMGYRGLRLPFQHLATDPPCSAISCHHCIFDDHFQSICRLAEFRYIRPNDSPSLALAVSQCLMELPVTC